MTAGRVLRRSRDGAVVAGVCGGLARCSGGSSLRDRLGFLPLSAISGGLAGLLYLWGWAGVPLASGDENVELGPRTMVEVEIAGARTRRERTRRKHGGGWGRRLGRFLRRWLLRRP